MPTVNRNHGIIDYSYSLMLDFKNRQKEKEFMKRTKVMEKNTQKMDQTFKTFK